MALDDRSYITYGMPDTLKKERLSVQLTVALTFVGLVSSYFDVLLFMFSYLGGLFMNKIIWF